MPARRCDPSTSGDADAQKQPPARLSILPLDHREAKRTAQDRVAGRLSILRLTWGDKLSMGSVASARSRSTLPLEVHAR